MNNSRDRELQKVLIASANPLFGKGLERMLARQWAGQPHEVQFTKTMAETFAAIESWQPALVIVDYDDSSINREEFLNFFVSGNQPMQVMLVSLQASGSVVVYDRKTLTPAQAEDWLSLPHSQKAAAESPNLLRRQSMKHFAIVAVLVAISTVLVSLVLNSVGLLPVQASTQAQPIDRLFQTHFLLISFLFSLIVVLLVYSLVVFRKRAGSDEEGQYIKGSTGLEIVWTILPLGAVIYFSYLGSIALADTRRVDPQALEIKVVGGQWYWRFEYPEYGITSNVMYMPVNRQAHLKLTSMDVIHSFWVPEFRVKQDVLPGENLVKELRITPNVLGDYKVRCAEMCGTSHAYMENPVKVVSQADFDTWVDTEMKALGANPAERGQKWATNNGCTSCHSLDGKAGVGPTWLGLYGKQNELADGSTVTVDDEYLRNGILQPNLQIAKGYSPNVMPQTYGNTLSEQQITDMIEFIKTLQ